MVVLLKSQYVNQKESNSTLTKESILEESGVTETHPAIIKERIF